ncbi:MAG: DMT family transporter [Pseudomonadota bacterium]
MLKKNKISRCLVGESILLFVTLCWGMSFPLVGNSVATVDPSVFVMVRFFLAALILLPFVFLEIKKSSKNVLVAGMIIAAFNVVVYISQTIGMQTVTSAEGSFITGISVVIVPFILPFFALGKPSKKDILCSFLCLLGLFFLVGGNVSHLSTGDAWVLLCAIFVAITIVYLQKVSSVLSSLSLLAFYQIFFTGVFSIPFTLGKSFLPLLTYSVVGAILFCALFATAIALLLQTKFQHYTTANRAAMIFCFEPIFGSLFGYLINNEKIGWSVFIGGACILTGTIFSLIKVDKYQHFALDA